jgi:hypothetical protein
MVRLAFAFLLSLCVSAHAQLSGGVGGFPGPGTAHSASYAGPGDVTGWTTGVVWWVGTRGYNSAYSGNAVEVCNSGDVACVNMAISGGNLTVTTVGGTDCSVSTCTIKTFYDQSGANACTGSVACNFAQATESRRAQFIVSCQNGRPCARCTSSASANGYTAVAAVASSHAQPFVISAVAKRTANFTTLQAVSGDTNITIGFNSAADQWFLFAGGLPAATATDNTLHAVQSFFNGASSAAYIDGSNTVLDPGTTGVSGTFKVCNNNNQPLSGDFMEAGMWDGDKSANHSNMNTNQHNYWNF